jgi:hypothetical protein
MSPESGDGIRSAQIPTTKLVVFRPSGQNGRIWPEYPGQNSQIPAVLAGFSAVLSRNATIFAEIRSFLSESGHFRRNLANPDFDETVRIPAFISNSGYSSWNPVKVAEILSVSDGISSPMIFILFYINTYMF